MAHNSTSRRRFGAAAGALSVSVIAAAALIGMAGTASAHTPKLDGDCSPEGSWAKVELKQYNDKQDNTVKITLDDEVVVQESFRKEFSKAWDELDPTVAHLVQVDVKAWDDPDGSKKFSFTDEVNIEACVQPEEPSEEPSVPAEPSEPVETSPETTAPPAPSEVPTTSVEVEEAALAETGASIAIPLGIGAVLLAGGVVLMVVVRRRGRADHQA